MFRSRGSRMTVLALVGVLGGGAASAAYAVLGEDTAAGQGSGQGSRYAETRLLFGTARPDGGPAVTEREFREFVDEVITPRFPEGLTVQEGYGQWRDAQGSIEQERSYELILYYPVAEQTAGDREIEEVREEYLVRFGQEAVGRVDDRVRLDF